MSEEIKAPTPRAKASKPRRAAKPKHKPSRTAPPTDEWVAIAGPSIVMHEPPASPIQRPALGASHSPVPSPSEVRTASELEHFVGVVVVCGLALESVGVDVHWRGVVDAVRSRNRVATRLAYNFAKEALDDVRDSTGRWLVRSIQDRFQNNVMRLAGYALGWEKFDDLWIWLRIETAAINAYVAALSPAGGAPS